MEITGIISALIIGLVIGALGRLVDPGRQRIPIWLTIIIGIIAALIGTGIATLLGVADTAGIDWIELGIQVALAALGVAACRTGQVPCHASLPPLERLPHSDNFDCNRHLIGLRVTLDLRRNIAVYQHSCVQRPSKVAELLIHNMTEDGGSW